MTWRGFTLVELLVAVILAGIVATASVRLLVDTRRLHDAALARLDLEANLRAGAAVLAAQLREVARGVPPAGDLVAFGPASVAYRAVRGLYQTCRSASGSTVWLDPAPLLGRRAPDPAEDELMIYVPVAEQWVHLDAVGLTAGTDCPGSSPSVAVQLAGVVPAVAAGTPVRAARRFELRLYKGGDGAWWIGGREFVRGTASWAATQPVIGPVAPAGLMFTYFAADHSATADPSQVVRIGITLVMLDRAGRTASSSVSVALRNQAAP